MHWLKDWSNFYVMARKTGHGQRFFPYSGDQYLAIWHEAVRRCGLSILMPVPYMLRHAGPSYDILTKLRTLPEVQRRGRWLSLTSVRRYEKARQVTAQLQKLAPATRKWCRLCEENLEHILVRGAAPPEFCMCF